MVKDGRDLTAKCVHLTSLFVLPFLIVCGVLFGDEGARGVLVEDRVEDVLGRGGTQRVWNVVREVEVWDRGRGEVVVEEIEATIVEVGNGICYRDESGGWQVSDPRWVRSDGGFVLEGVGYDLRMGGLAGDVLVYGHGGKTVRLRADRVAVSDGTVEDVIGVVDGDVAGRIDREDASRLIFADAFGAGIDLELECGGGGYHQNVIFHGRPAISGRVDIGRAEIKIYTEVDVSENTVTDGVRVRAGRDRVRDIALAGELRGERGTLSIVGDVDRGGEVVEERLISFGESVVFDSNSVTGSGRDAAVKRVVSGGGGTRYLEESLSYEYFAGAEYPVVWDYAVKPVTGVLESDTVWYARNTYHVTGDFDVDDYELRIEPGTFVKFADGKKLSIGGSGKIIARGKPHMNIVFTSENDNSNGETITGSSGTPARGDWAFIELDDDSEFEYCSVFFSDGVDITGCLAIPFQHNYLYANWQSVYVGSTAIDSSESLSIFNNLIVPDPSSRYVGTYGIYIGGGSTGDIYCYNNTIHTARRGVAIVPTCEYTLTLYNNIFASCSTGIWGIPGFDDTYLSSSNDGFYNNTTDSDVPNSWSPTNKKTTSTNPFYGDSAYNNYLLNDSDPGGMDFVGEGTGTAASYYGDVYEWAVHNLKDVASTRVFSSSKSIPTNTTWNKQTTTCDTGTVDLGYHAPRVDYIIDESDVTVDGGAGTKAVLTIEAGVVIAQDVDASTGAGKVVVDGGDTDGQADGIVCVGDPSGDGYVRWVDLGRVRRYLQAGAVPYGNLQNNIELDGDSEYAFRFCEFVGLGRCVVPSEESGVIRDCKFLLNTRGVDYQGCDGFAISNCLFVGNNMGVRDYDGYGSIANCTFDGNRYGVVVVSDGTLEVTNCLFTGSVKDGGVGHGISYRDSGAILNESYNAFWGNNFDIYDYYASEEIDIDDDTDQDLASDPYDSGWDDFGDRFFLNQGGDCVVEGGYDPRFAGMAFYTTGDDDRCDVAPVDIGYHYPGVVRYVDADSQASPANQDGLGWATSYKYLQDALDEAWTTKVTGIAVAKGTYYPDEDNDDAYTDDRLISFALVDGLGLYGGFAGGVSGEDVFDFDLNSRNFKSNETELSGDIDKNTFLDSNNTYSVVYCESTVPVIFDGFTVKQGNSDDTSTYLKSCGGGILNFGGKLHLRNSKIAGNWALSGGGLYDRNSTGTLVLNCIFADNVAKNVSYGTGGGINCENSSGFEMTNCTVVQNTADLQGGGFVGEDSSTVEIKNSIIWGNTDSFGNADVDSYSQSAIYLEYSDYGVLYELYGTITFDDCISVDPQFSDAANGDFRLKSVTGRWNPVSENWVLDSLTSPCVNLGGTSFDYSLEPTPNGGRINAGAYGNTIEASKVELHTIAVTLATDDGQALPSGAQWIIYYYPEDIPYDGIFRDSGSTIELPYDTYALYCTIVNDYNAPLGLSITAGSGQSTQYTRTYQTLYRYVSTGGSDSNDGKTRQSAFETIGQGISDVPGGGTVTVLSGLYYENLNIPTGKAFTLLGESRPTIDGRGLDSVIKCEYVDSGVTISNFTLQDGDAIRGGGLFISNCSPTIGLCSIEQNFATNNGGYAYGGGIFIQGGSPQINYCTINSNNADGSSGGTGTLGYGGGIYTYLTTAVFTGCTIGTSSANDVAVADDHGDEIYTDTDDGSTKPTYTNCQVRDGFSGDYCQQYMFGPIVN